MVTTLNDMIIPLIELVNNKKKNDIYYLKYKAYKLKGRIIEPGIAAH